MKPVNILNLLRILTILTIVSILGILVFSHASPVSAKIIGWSDFSGSGLPACPNPVDPGCSEPTPCWNAASVGLSENCGTACTIGNPWGKYTSTECVSQDGLTCGVWYVKATNFCSTADKYNASYPPTMKQGLCECQQGSIYKTCCSGSTPVNANILDSDNGIPPSEAGCGSNTTVMCLGGLGVTCSDYGFSDGGSTGQPNSYCTNQPCGTSACQAISPPPPSTCQDGTLYGACSTNKPQYCSNGTLINACGTCGCPDPGGQTCNTSTGACEAKVFIQGRLCRDDDGQGDCDANEPFILDPSASSSGCTNYVQPSGVGFSVSITGNQNFGPLYASSCNTEPYYSSGLIPAGSYTVTANVSSGWTVTSANNVSVNLTPSQWADVWFAIKPPAAPTPTPTPAPTLTVSATPATCAQGTYISLSWNSVTGATSYDVWRQPPGGTWTRLTPFGGIAPTSYTDSSVSRGNSYNYQVYANSAGVWSNIASVAASDFAVCPTVSPTAPPTPTPTPCQVTTSPSVLNLTVGGATGTVTASVTSGLGSATINRMRFGSYNTSLATVNPTTDLSSPYSTQVMAQACGATAVWGTADLSDGRICQSAAATDTNINVTCPTPTPTSPPTPTPDSSTTLTVFSWNWDTGRFFSGVPITGTQGGTSGTTTYQIGLETNINTTLTAPSSYNGVPFKGWLSCNSRPSTYSCRKSVAVGSDATVIVDYQTTYIISGTVYMDTNENGAKDVGESNYSGGTTVTGPASTTTDISGFYSFSGLGPATYIISLTVPSGYIATTANPGSASLPPDGVVNFGIKPEPTYTISGNVFEDSNDDGVKNGTETNYSGSITISSTGGTVTYPGGGTFSVANLVAGSYTISHDLPSGYTRTYPTNGPPASFTVTVGPSCSTGGANSATCSSGNITSLNFGILSYSPWIQSYGTDVRFDDGFINRMPPFVSDPPTCGSYSSAASYEGYEKINPSSGEYDEGISFTGDSPSDFGSGTAGRHNGWVAGGTSNPEVYNPSKGVLPTSYSFVLSLLKRKGLTSSDISGRCGGGGLGNCQISSSLPLTSGTLGIYKADGNLNLTINTSPLFQNNGDYIILVNGNMTIKNSIEVQTGTTAVFVVSGNITVDKNVGTSDIINSTEKHLQGFYSTDKSFILEGLNNCPATSDKRLNVGGAVIVNAARGGGSFVNNRSLCDSNSLCPVFSVQSRADFIINAPSEIQTQKTVYQEVAP